MATVRAFERADAQRVAALFERVSRSGSREPAPGLASYFERTFFGDPWRDPEIPSLVYETDGAITGFIGVHVRRLLFEGRPVRMAVTAQLVSDPDPRGRPPGLLLLRRALGGAQDLTISNAGPDVTRMWESLGGRVSHIGSVEWMHVLRPAHMVAGTLLRRTGRGPLGSYVRPLADAVDGLAAPAATRLAQRLGASGGDQGGPPPRTASEPLRPGLMVDLIASLTAGARYRPDYDEDYLAWVLAEMQALSSRGEVHARYVRTVDGRPLGWYVAQLGPHRVSRLYQLIASERDTGAVLDDLLAAARASGTPGLAGRVEPSLFRSLWERPVFLLRNVRSLVHSADRRLLEAVLLGEGVLTQMDGEAWMGHYMRIVPSAGSTRGPSFSEPSRERSWPGPF